MEGLITAVTGPLGALALSVAIIVYLAKEIVPALKAYFDAQTKQLQGLVEALNRTIDAHEADRAAFERSIERLGSRLEKVENDITAIAAKLH
jgi:septal ring factor EnvC (AmiA/AmiB activator)